MTKVIAAIAGLFTGASVMLGVAAQADNGKGYGEWKPVPERMVGQRVDDVNGHETFRLGRHALWHVGDTTYFITMRGRVGTS